MSFLIRRDYSDFWCRPPQKPKQQKEAWQTCWTLCLQLLDIIFNNSTAEAAGLVLGDNRQVLLAPTHTRASREEAPPALPSDAERPAVEVVKF